MQHIKQFGFTSEELTQRFFIPFNKCDTALVVSEGKYLVVRKDELTLNAVVGHTYDDIFESIASRYTDYLGYTYVFYLRTTEHNGNPSIYSLGIGKWFNDFLTDELSQDQDKYESLVTSIGALMHPDDYLDLTQHVRIKPL